MEKIVKEFITEHIKIILNYELHEQMLLHLITLFDAQQLDKDKLVALIKHFNDEKNLFYLNLNSN